MRTTDKKALKAILNEVNNLYDQADKLRSMLEDLKQDHEEWMDERDDILDGRFFDTPTGEKAQDDQDNFEDWWDRVDTLCTDIEYITNEIEDNL